MKNNKLYFFLLFVCILHLLYPIWIAQNIGSNQMHLTKFLMLLLCSLGGVFLGGSVISGGVKSLFLLKTTYSPIFSSSSAVIITSVMTASTTYLAFLHQSKSQKITNQTSQLDNFNRNDSLNQNLLTNHKNLDSIVNLPKSQITVDSNINLNSNLKLNNYDNNTLTENSKKDTINHSIKNAPNKPTIDSSINANSEDITNEGSYFHLEPIHSKIKFHNPLANIHSERINDIWVRTPRKSDMNYGSNKYFILYPNEMQFSKSALNNFLQSDLFIVNTSTQRNNYYTILKVVRKNEDFYTVEYHIFHESENHKISNYFRLFSPHKFYNVKDAINTNEFMLFKL